MAMPIPDDWDGESWNCWMIEWPSSTLWTAILCGFVTQPTRGRFWDASTGSVEAAQATGKEIENRNETEDWCMTCLSELAEAISSLGTSIRSGGGCVVAGQTGTVGAGGVSQEPSAFIDDGISTFPTGYPDRPEYEDYKCGMAEDARAKWESDISNAKILNLVGLTLSGVLFQLGAVGAVAFATPIPFDDLIVLAGAMLAIVALLVDLATALQQAQDYVNAFDLCIWYDASDVTEAIDDTHSDIDAQTFPITDTQVKDILKAFISTDMLNPLFEEKPEGADYSGVGDCSGCGACEPIKALELSGGGFATITEVTPDTVYDIEAAWNTLTSRWEAVWGLNTNDDQNPPASWCGPERNASVVVLSGTVSHPGPPDWRIFDQLGATVYSSNTIPPGDVCGAVWVVVSSTTFTLQTTLGTTC